MDFDNYVRVGCWRPVQYCCLVCHTTTCNLTRAEAGVFRSNAVDLFNSVTRAWSTARLSVARSLLAAASVGNVALFAGGSTSSAFSCRDGG